MLSSLCNACCICLFVTASISMFLHAEKKINKGGKAKEEPKKEPCKKGKAKAKEPPKKPKDCKSVFGGGGMCTTKLYQSSIAGKCTVICAGS